ncbi:hypothetical protein WISP_22891 [Willisornis vidua]|uniref:Uncharacterized protein n=1 Tax=Willisornis vidua TaxID=1566151 RepID=A0ABQ9DTH8_9PASS|nr:hypothetical protein WISP_22891 [Willisornis vidua]
MERELGVLVDGKLDMSQQCPGSQEGQPCPGGHQAQHRQLGEGGDCPALLCTGAASPRALGSVLGLHNIKIIMRSQSVQKRTMKMVKHLERKPFEEHLGAPWSVQPGEEETKGKPHCNDNFLMRRREWVDTDLFSEVTSDRTRGTGLKMC